ncbi:MAG: YbjQ family protein [Clostridium sp.]|nr:YbjQ family protein [Clostridium sp.]
MKVLDECGFFEDGKQYIVSVVDAKGDEISKHWVNAENQQQLKHLIDPQILTTGYNFEKYKITSYLGVISGSTVLGTGFLSEFNATLSDIFGAQSDLFSEKSEKAKETSLSKLKEKSVRMGGNAIIDEDEKL